VATSVAAAALPSGVDAAQRERALSPEAFAYAFRTAGVAGGPGPATLAEFDALPGWKQKQLRQKANLF
jgi:hypothetical protein